MHLVMFIINMLSFMGNHNVHKHLKTSSIEKKLSTTLKFQEYNIKKGVNWNDGSKLWRKMIHSLT